MAPDSSPSVDRQPGTRSELACTKAANRALGNVLKIIGRSPERLEDVFETILESALSLCEAQLGILFLYDPEEGYRAAHMKGVPQPLADWFHGIGAFHPDAETGLGRVAAHPQAVSIADVQADDIYAGRDPLRVATVDLGGARSFAAIPMISGDRLKGVITIYRQQVRPFETRHIELVDLFADQAMIALETMRLVNETRALSKELAELNASLQQRVSKQVDELERMARLRQFLSPEIADIVMASGDQSLLASHRRQIATVFCDLRGFTAFSETAEPEEVMEVLKTFHAETGRLISRFHGTIGHRAGDGLMVVLNDPIPVANPARAAAELALALLQRVTELCRGWSQAGYDLGVGVGLSFGYATLGIIGDESRYDYTAIGTVVNIASRLCDEAADGEVLTTQRVLAELGEDAEVAHVKTIELKGVSRPVKIFRLKAMKADP